MKKPDPTYRTLCQLLAGQACPEFHRLCWAKVSDRAPQFHQRADVSRTSTLSPDDWRLLAATARREGVAPLLYPALKEQKSRGAEVQECEAEPSSSPHLPLSPAPHLPCVPPDVQADLRQAYYATTARNLLLYHELSRLLTALSAPPQSPTPNIQYPISNIQPPIPVILLKGAALAATLYPSIGLRPMGDLDLLVPEERLAEAVARLKALGYVQPHPEMAAGLNALAGHHVNLQGGRDVHLPVELHWPLVSGEHDWRSPSLPWFWQQTEPCPNLQSLISNPQYPISNPQSPAHDPPSVIITLTPTAHLLYLSAHLMLQHGEARSALRWFYDIYLLVKRSGQRSQWDEAVARAREFRWAPALYAALKGSHDRFCDSSASEGDAWLPPGVLEALAEASDLQASRLVARRADRLQTRATGVVAAASSLSPGARLRLLRAIAIPSPAYVRWRYQPRPAWLWPLCYPYRWLDILREGLTTLWRMASRRWRANKK